MVLFGVVVRSDPPPLKTLYHRKCLFLIIDLSSISPPAHSVESLASSRGRAASAVGERGGSMAQGTQGTRHAPMQGDGWRTADLRCAAGAEWLKPDTESALGVVWIGWLCWLAAPRCSASF